MFINGSTEVKNLVKEISSMPIEPNLNKASQLSLHPNYKQCTNIKRLKKRVLFQMCIEKLTHLNDDQVIDKSTQPESTDLENKENVPVSIRPLSVSLQRLSEKKLSSYQTQHNECDSSVKHKVSSTQQSNYHIERSFECSQCDDICFGEIQFEKHFESAHSLFKEKAAQCPECREIFDDKNELVWHCQATHFQVQLLECPYCKVMSLDVEQMRHHLKVTHTKMELKCSVCDRVFDVEDALLKHFDEEHFFNS